MKLPFSYDPVTGIQKFFHFQAGVGENQFAIQTIQPTTEIIEANKRDYNDNAALGKSRADGMEHVARIPISILMDLRKKGIMQDKKAFMAWLNKPENRFFRVRAGSV